MIDPSSSFCLITVVVVVVVVGVVVVVVVIVVVVIVVVVVVVVCLLESQFGLRRVLECVIRVIVRPALEDSMVGDCRERYGREERRCLTTSRR